MELAIDRLLEKREKKRVFKKMDSPEYDTLTMCFPKLFCCIKQSPIDVAMQLVPSGILASGDWTFISNPQNNDGQKAMKIVDIVRNQVQLDSKVYCNFISALEAAGSWTKTIVCELEHTRESLLQCCKKKFCGRGVGSSEGEGGRMSPILF